MALWAPLMQGSAALFFADVRGKLFEQDVTEFNFPLGYRQMTASGWNLGVWSGLDVRHTEADNNFWQVSGGLEALSANWDPRVNGYAPVTGSEASPSLAKVSLSGNSITMTGGEEVPLYGVDGEVGVRLFGTSLTAPGRRHEFRVFGGGFWFDHADALKEVAGPKARAEWRIDNVVEAWAGSRLTIEGEYSHDEVRHDRWEVGARLRLPFGGARLDRYAALTPQERRMEEGLVRDTDIVTVESKAEPVEDTLTGIAFDRVAYVEGGGSVTNTSNGEGDDTLIIATGTIDGPQQLQGDQTLQGGGSTIQVTGRRSGTVAGFTAPGSRPTPAMPGNAANLTLIGSNTHVAGLDIVGIGGTTNTSNTGIFGGTGLSNMFIEQTNIDSAGGTGIRFNGGNEVTITDVTITNSTIDGMLFGQNNTITVADARIDGAGVDGIAFAQFNSMNISNTVIANVGDSGIEAVSGNVATISGLSIENADSGIVIQNGNAFTITDTTIRNVNFDGISFFAGNTMTIANTIIADVGRDGLNTEGSLNTISLDNSTLAGTFGNSGLYIDGTDNTLSGTGNTAAGATFTNQFCEVIGGQAGQISFDIGTCP